MEDRAEKAERQGGDQASGSEGDAAVMVAVGCACTLQLIARLVTLTPRDARQLVFLAHRVYIRCCEFIALSSQL